MKIFMTGGMGFIGSSVVTALLDKGHELTLLSRNPDKIPDFKSNPGIRVLKGGLEDKKLIEDHLQGHEACIHNALNWGNSAIEMLTKDTLSSVFIFEKAAEAGIKRFIYTSSTAAMGEFREKMDEETKSKPINYYCATKAASEEYLLAVSYQYPMICSIIRPGYTFGRPVIAGAPMEVDSRFREIVMAALEGRDITVTINDGTQFIWAGDLAKIYLSVLDSGENRNIYFGMGKDYITWEKVAIEAVKQTASGSRIIKIDGGIGAISLFDLSKIKNSFGYSFDSWDKIVSHLKYLAETIPKN